MVERSFLAFDNEAFIDETTGNGIINNSDTPTGTFFTYVGGFPVEILTVEDTFEVDSFNDDSTGNHIVTDGGSIVANGTQVESESYHYIRQVDGSGVEFGPTITITVFSKGGVTSDIFGMTSSEPLSVGARYVKTGGSNAGTSDYASFVSLLAEDDGATTDENVAVTVAVLSNDADTNANPLAITAFSQGTNGSVVLDDNGTAGDTTDDRLVYTPDTDFVGSDSFTYTISNGAGASESASVTVTVVDVNADPTAVDDITVGFQGQQASFDVLANDSDPDNDGLLLTDAVMQTSGAGTVGFNPAGTVTFTPDTAFTGPVTVAYTVSDGNGGSDTGVLTINVIPNAAPVIQEPVSFQMDENQSLAANLQATDPEGDTLTWSVVGGPDAALFSVDPSSGQLSFLSPPDFEAPLDQDGNNQYTLTVRVDDAFGFDTQSILVRVRDVDENPNDPPVFTTPLAPPGFPAVLVLTGQSQDAVGSVGATDPNLDTLDYSLFGEDANLFVIDAGTGEISFADAGVTGRTVGHSFDGDRVYELDVLVTDGNGGSDVLDLELPLFLGG